MCTQTLDIIINCAASVDFNTVLDQAININVKGAMRVLKLAQEC